MRNLVPGTHLVPEVADAGENQCDIALVRCGDYFVITDRAAGGDDGRDAELTGLIDIVSEGEEGIGRHHGSFGWKAGLHRRDFGGIDAAHLSGADTDGSIRVGEDDRVGFDMPHHLPGEIQRQPFFFIRLTLRRHLAFAEIDLFLIAVLAEEAPADLPQHLNIIRERFTQAGEFEEAKIFLLL